MSAMASQITSLKLFTQPFVQAQIKENIKGSASLAFVKGIHRWPMNSPHKGPVTRKMFPFDDVIMAYWDITEFMCSIDIANMNYSRQLQINIFTYCCQPDWCEVFVRMWLILRNRTGLYWPFGTQVGFNQNTYSYIYIENRGDSIPAGNVVA